MGPKTKKRAEALGLTEEIIIDRIRQGQNTPAAILPTLEEQTRRVEGVVAYRVLDAMLQSMRKQGKIRFTHALLTIGTTTATGTASTRRIPFKKTAASAIHAALAGSSLMR